MKFDSKSTSRTYSDRIVDSSWALWVEENHPPTGLDIVDIGCGGGIYSTHFLKLGARSVLGVDRSAQYIAEANASFQGYANCTFMVGDATDLQIDSGSCDLVFQRALIHHLTVGEQTGNSREVFRILKPNGVAIIQDRTFDDVSSDNPAFWIRSTLFELFPRLIEIERSRRPDSGIYTRILREAGFGQVNRDILIETRQHYSSFEILQTEILQRKGKSILFELSDPELHVYCEALYEKSQCNNLKECDQWSVWSATV